STLWLRILGRGKTQRQAIMELFNSGIDDPLYTLARQQLHQWYQLLLPGDMGKESQLLMQTLASLI
ncbi:MAG: flagellar assembly protein H, partial [Sphaerospermopsis kisseleviana]